jgi:hypothetical protein
MVRPLLRKLEISKSQRCKVLNLSRSSRHFLSQNAAIAAGRAYGITLNLKVLGIGDGLTVGLPHLIIPFPVSSQRSRIR